MCTGKPLLQRHCFLATTIALLATLYVLGLLGLVSAPSFAVVPQLVLTSWDLGLHRLLF